MFNLHTHFPALIPGSVIENCGPETFLPRPGRYYSVGIHPWHCKQSTSDTWSLLEVAARHPQVVAIGEAGLDKACSTPLGLQEEAFARQARLADEMKKPLIIHLVRATDELLRLRKELRPTVAWIVHGFRGKPRQAEQLLHHGFYLSLGQYFNPETARIIPLDRLFCETDESPELIDNIARRIAEARGIGLNEMEEAVEENLRRVFSV